MVIGLTWWIRNSGKLLIKFYIYILQIWIDNSRYEGEWLDDMQHNKGIMKHIDGDTYDGEWKYDMANGYGIYIDN